MNLSLQTTLEYPAAQVAELLTIGFSEYSVPVEITEQTLFKMVRQDSVDLSSSYVVCSENTPIGIALIGRRGWASRLAAMSILPEHREKGVGSYVLERLLQESSERGDKKVELEVIEDNEPAVRLYKKFGFTDVRRLRSYSKAGEPAFGAQVLKEVNLSDLASKVLVHGLRNLPWQISGCTLGNCCLPNRAFQLDAAFIGLSDIEQEEVSILSLLVLPDARGQGQAKRILQAAMNQFQATKWKVPAVCPEKIGDVFEKTGFNREPVSQFQMELRH